MAKKSGAPKRESNSNNPTNAKSNKSKRPVQSPPPPKVVEEEPDSLLMDTIFLSAIGYVAYLCLKSAYEIRLHAVEEYGPVIHEFDPYFNFRATEYLYHNGPKRFFQWFDYKSWYPLGRPVGTTIYPGMQFTAVFIKRFLVGDKMSLNDVCVYIPAWFGVIAAFTVGCIAYECTLECNTMTSVMGMFMDLISGKRSDLDKNDNESEGGEKKPVQRRHDTALGFDVTALCCGVTAMYIMAVVPAHLTRSVAGGYDNESVAMSAMVLTFYFWIRSLRSGDDFSYLYGILSGLAYFYMVAAWGGYVFVLNMVGVHAALLVLTGRFTTKVYLSYTLFYAIGTALAIQIPVVGLTPLKSLEQLGPCVLFVGYQILQFCDIGIRRRNLGRVGAWKYRIQVFLTIAVIGGISIAFLAPQGYFGPISSRVRGLFVKHTKTGNPLVDSVAEHQPADPSAYFRYLQHLCTFAPIGFFIVLFKFGDAAMFVVAYALTAYYFSLKMVRLILLMGPVSSILAGISIAHILMWCFLQLWNAGEEELGKDGVDDDESDISSQHVTKKIQSRRKGSRRKSSNPLDIIKNQKKGFDALMNSDEGVMIKRGISPLLFIILLLFGHSFQDYCWKMSKAISNPSIVQKGQLRSGEVVVVDDYREAYHWIRDNTPEDARVLAWWDYGYQITAIANRTTIADGNTWNHEHIALLGKVLTTDIDEGYSIARHLADYVLIWAGGGPDDLAKSPHLARIANSVYRDLCPNDPTCRAFTFLDRNRTPSPMMKASFLYTLHSHQIAEGVVADPAHFSEVFRSKFGKVRVFKINGVDEESKAWVADPNNRLCDVEGGWYCRGQYPPALKKVLDQKKDFAQLEDFNSRKSDDDYQKQYFEYLNNPEIAKAKARKQMEADLREKEKEKAAQEKVQKETSAKAKASAPSKPVEPTKDEIDKVYNTFEDTELTTNMWKIISSGTLEDLENALQSSPIIAHLRSADGRGPMWWAFENRKQDMVRVLMKHGVSHTDKDKKGITPVDLLEPTP